MTRDTAKRNRLQGTRYMLGPYTSFPESLPEDLTGKPERPEGAETLLLRFTLAAPREDSRVEKVSGVVTPSAWLYKQQECPAMKDGGAPRGGKASGEGQGVSACCVLVPNSLQRYTQ